MEERADPRVAFSHMASLAALSIVLLIGIVLWQTTQLFFGEGGAVAVSPSAPLPERAPTPFDSIDWQAARGEGSAPVQTDDTEGLGNIADNVLDVLVGSYSALASTDSFSSASGEAIAEDIAATLKAKVSYSTFSAADVQIDADISAERSLAYRHELRIALEPLLQNPGYELGIFANYLDTGDQKYLEALQATEKNYQDAIGNVSALVVPSDAVSFHLDVLNSMSAFSATLARLTAHAEDPFATAALLRTYNDSEAALMVSFDKLATYFKSKQS